MRKSLPVYSPYDGHLIKELQLLSPKEVEKVITTAHNLTKKSSNILPLPQRIAILEKAANLVEQRAEELAKQATEEGGKPLIDSRVELQRAVQGIREAASCLTTLTGRVIPMGINGASINRTAFTMREPAGVVVAISAFNHPFNLIVHQVIPAVAVGCPVIVRPSNSTPLSCINLVNILHEAGLPKQWCQVAICHRKQAEKLATSKRTAFFTFIGSGKVGWALKAKLAAGTRCALEHGGVAPVIVEADADLKDALPLLAKGGFYHAGQVCVSVQKIYVHEKLAERLTKGLVKLAAKLTVGDPLNEKTEVGPIINEAEVARIDEWVKEAKALKAKVLIGGKKIGKTCYAPTIILNPPETAKVSTQEVFAPIICIYTYKDRLKAIERANALPFSFQASVFTKNLDVAYDTAKRINAAAVMINDHTAFRVDWMPFAGRKVSGYGIGGILPTMEEMTQEKLIVHRSTI